MRKVAGIAGMAAAVFAIAAPALGAGVAPKTGDYEAVPKGSGTVGLGVFRVIKVDDKFHMVVDSPQYSQIYYPDKGKCHSYDIGVSGTDYPISSNGKFHIEDSRPAGGHDIDVDWKGHWTSKSKLAGSIEISYKNCTDKRDFTGERVGGAS